MIFDFQTYDGSTGVTVFPDFAFEPPARQGLVIDSQIITATPAHVFGLIATADQQPNF